jgi:Tfp pilus assembly protein PilN
MIKINLIRQKRKKRREVNYGLVYGLSMAVFLVGLFSFHRTALVGKQRGLERDIQKAKQEITRLRKDIGEVEKFKHKKKELKNKVNIVGKLQKGRKTPVIIMDSLVHSVPEKAWLTQLNYKGKFLELTGYALNNYVVADFMNNLGSTKRFNNIMLLSAERKGVRGVLLMYFKIKCEVNA